jgi:hypothetical protein
MQRVHSTSIPVLLTKCPESPPKDGMGVSIGFVRGEGMPPGEAA